MKIKNHRDFWAGLLFVAVGLLFAIGASNHDLGDSREPGTGYFPLLLGLLLIALGCLVNFKALTFETDDGGPIGAIDWRALSLVLVAIVGAGFALPELGMLPTIPLLVLLLALASGRFSLLPWIALSMACAALCWLVFVHLLGLPLVLLPASWA